MLGKILEEEQKFHNDLAEKYTLQALPHIDKRSPIILKHDQAYEKKALSTIEEWLGEVKGKDILIPGCGFNYAPLILYMRGGSITALDISIKSLLLSKLYASNYSCEGVKFILSDAHFIPLKDNSFDIIYVVKTLHHLGINRALKEMFRVLRPGGKIILIEPLSGHPLIGLYRKLTPFKRTSTEHPLSLKNFIDTVNRFSECTNLQFFAYAFLSPLSYVLWSPHLKISKKGYLKIRDVLSKFDNYLIARINKSLGKTKHRGKNPLRIYNPTIIA